MNQNHWPSEKQASSVEQAESATEHHAQLPSPDEIRRMMEQRRNIISKKLKQYRIERGMTQEELAAGMQARGVNIDQQAISRIEKNARFVTDYELGCFCLALHVPLRDMMEDATEVWGNFRF
jgi:DNA-binding XRE family transcriptional regulator